MSVVIDNTRFRKLLRAYPKKAIKLLYDFYYSGLLGLARSLTHNETAAEDIVQEAFMSVWVRRKELCSYHETSFEHYLVRIVRNRSITYYKKQIKDSVELAQLVKATQNENDNPVEANIIQAEFVAEIRNVILSFPRAERECMMMNIYEEMTVDQIASHQRVTRKAVERSLTSARKRLRKWLRK